MKVGLFVPCYIDAFFPEVGVATLELLERLGCEVEYPPDQTCCGQPMANSGCQDDSAATEALFVLNRRRQLLFVNSAWETLTGHKARDVHKRVCKRQRDAVPGSCAAVQHALCPPRDVLDGKLMQLRRLYLAADGPRSWDVLFIPLLGPHGVLGVLGKIQPVGSGHSAADFICPSATYTD